MPRSSATTVENSFVNGLVTEATALNFPESAATDTMNCVFNLDGSFERRLGIDYEEGYTFATIDRTNRVSNMFSWYDAAGSGDYNFVVAQIGEFIHFWEIAENQLSGSKLSTTVDIRDFLADDAPPKPETKDCQFSYGKGYLFVTHPWCDPFYVSYDPTNHTMTGHRISIKIRDHKGVDDTLDMDKRPSTLESLHKYNLWNQGWNPFDSGGVTSPTLAGATGTTAPSGYAVGYFLDTWDANREDFPSNADVWWLFKDANEVFQPKLANEVTRGNSPAPKGHYLLDAFYKDRSAAVATTVKIGASSTAFSIPGLAVESASYHRPKTTAFFGSRVWFAGVDALGFSNTLYFSQMLKDSQDIKFGQCYQQNDPTSENVFDLLPTDGGTIQILDCGSIFKLFAMQSVLVIFASNGIWTISGSQGLGFTANDFSIQKISAMTLESASSFVDMGGTPCWWNTTGIYMIGQPDQINGVKLVSLTEKKIKKFFADEIPHGAKRYAKGIYNPFLKVVQWLYRSTEPRNQQEVNEYDRCLNYNTFTQAFYPWELPTWGNTINGIVSVNSFTSGLIDESVTVGGVVVTVETVAVNVSFFASDERVDQFKYLVSDHSTGHYRVTFADARDEHYKDFRSYIGGGLDYDSYIVSGYKVRGDAQRKFQSNYVFLYPDITRQSLFDFEAIWDYSSDPNNGDWGTVQRVDLSSFSGRKYKYRRLKVRGAGLSLQFRISSVSGSSFKIAGWSTFDTGNASV